MDDLRLYDVALTDEEILALVTPTPSLPPFVGIWTFDGDAADSSDNGNDGELVDGATFSDDTARGEGGQSLLLADGGHVLVEHSESLNITNAISIGAWVKPVGENAWDGVIAKNPREGSGDNHAGNYELRVASGTRHLHQCFLDATAMVANYGRPDALITMTASPRWPEVTAHLRPGEQPQEPGPQRLRHALRPLRRPLAQRRDGPAHARAQRSSQAGGGRAGGRAGGGAEGRAGGPAGGQAGGRAGGRAGRRAGEQARGRADKQAGEWVGRQASARAVAIGHFYETTGLQTTPGAPANLKIVWHLCCRRRSARCRTAPERQGGALGLSV